MMQRILADKAVSISELRKNPSALLDGANGGPVAVLCRNRVMGYMVPTEVFESMVECLDDLELTELVRARSHETPVPVMLDDL